MFELIPFSNSRRNIWGYLDNLERGFFQSMTPATGLLRTDIVDAGDHYVLSAEMPGFKKEDISIDLSDGTLTISAQRTEENEKAGGNYLRRERRVGSYMRSFDVSEVKTDAITASYTDGILSLKLPKIEEPPLPPSRQIAIH